jgi:hypothetical protein
MLPPLPACVWKRMYSKYRALNCSDASGCLLLRGKSDWGRHLLCAWLGSRANDCFHTTARARPPLHCTGTPPRFRSDSIGRWLIGSMLRYCTYPSDPASPIQRPFFESRKNSRGAVYFIFSLFFFRCVWVGWVDVGNKTNTY